MAGFSKFTDIIAWKKAFELSKLIYAETIRPPFSRDFELRGQIKRAAISISANIAEGFERGGNKEFIHFLSIAKGSAGEVDSLLYIAHSQEYIDKNTFHKLLKLTDEIGRTLRGLITYLQGSKLSGTKFRLEIEK